MGRVPDILQERTHEVVAKSILIVDDEELVRNVLHQKLERMGYDTCGAADGKEAVRALRTVPFDLVITDIIMPGMDGLETIRFLRKEQPNVKIIAISATSNHLYLENACGLGADRVFQKPLKLADLAVAVNELIAS
jgi:CheY-like chemotaxis protein